MGEERPEDKALEDKWVKDANDYLQKSPNGDHAAELQVALAERLQKQGDLLGAAKLYSQVKGDPEFTFTAKFKAAECYYKIIVGAGAAAKDNKGPKTRYRAAQKAGARQPERIDQDGTRRRGKS